MRRVTEHAWCQSSLASSNCFRLVYHGRYVERSVHSPFVAKLHFERRWKTTECSVYACYLDQRNGGWVWPLERQKVESDTVSRAAPDSWLCPIRLAMLLPPEGTSHSARSTLRSAASTGTCHVDNVFKSDLLKES